MLASAAVAAARRWRFGPTLLNGIPVRVTGVIVFVFRLNE
jgi:protein TonB